MEIKDRKETLKKIVKNVFGTIGTDYNEEKKEITLGAGNYPSKCRFIDNDRNYYVRLFYLAFLDENTKFVYNNNTKAFDRNKLISNTINYLSDHNIFINCTLYTNNENKLLRNYLHKIIRCILEEVFPTNKEYRDEDFKNNVKKIISNFRSGIINKGIISQIYEGVKWGAVESNGNIKSKKECLLIDIEHEAYPFLNIYNLDTTLKLMVKTGNDDLFPTGFSYECDSVYNLRQKNVQDRDVKLVYLDLLNFNKHYYVPNRFRYNVEHIFDVNDVEETSKDANSKDACDIGREYQTRFTKGYKELSDAFDYLRENYPIDRKEMLITAFSDAWETMIKLLQVNFNRFYEDEFPVFKSLTSFADGLVRLKYFLNINDIKYEDKEIEIIYKYLITLWTEKFRAFLDNLNFEELFNIYITDETVAARIDKILKPKKRASNILDTGNKKYIEFYKKNRKLIEDFESKVLVEKTDSFDYMIYRESKEPDKEKLNPEYKRLDSLKKSITSFQEKLNFDVPYYEKKIFNDGVISWADEEKYIGTGHVGDTVELEIEQIEGYTVEGPDSIKLGFGKNVFERKYTKIDESLPENNDVTAQTSIAEKKNNEVNLRKNHKYKISFAACGDSEAPFIFTILRRNSNGNLEVVFEKNGIILNTSFNNYSFEFTYNGEDDDICSIMFGYENFQGRYTVKVIDISEI